MQSITVHHLIMSCSSQSKHIKHIRNNTVDIPLPSSLGRVRITSFFRRQLQPLETARMTASGSTQEIKTTMDFRMAIYYFHSQFISLVWGKCLVQTWFPVGFFWKKCVIFKPSAPSEAPSRSASCGEPNSKITTSCAFWSLPATWSVETKFHIGKSIKHDFSLVISNINWFPVPSPQPSPLYCSIALPRVTMGSPEVDGNVSEVNDLTKLFWGCFPLRQIRRI